MQPQVREDLLDHRLLQDRRDDLQVAAAIRAVLHVVNDSSLPISKGSTAYDLARERQAATRWNLKTQDAVVKRLEAVTPRRGWFGR